MMIANVDVHMLKKLASYHQTHGTLALLGLCLYPLTLLLWNPCRLVATLWYARVLANGCWSEYNRFRVWNGVNSLFYWTQAWNLDQYGRRGISPTLGTGRHPLGDWWHISLTSLYLSWRLGAMFPLLCLFGWLGGHSLWLSAPGVDAVWLGAVLCLALCSSYFFSAAFVSLNYNALGWLFVPVGLWGLLTQNVAVAAVAWFAASLGSLTVCVIAGAWCVAWSVQLWSVWPMLTLLPAGFKLLSHFCFTPQPWASLQRIVAGIGLTGGRGVKYQRDQHTGTAHSWDVYWQAMTYAVFASFAVYLDSPAVVLCVVVVLLFGLNVSIMRFADPQSLAMAMFSAATAVAILTPNLWLLAAYWLVVSPLPFTLGDADDGDSLVLPPARKPFHIQPLLARADAFLDKIPAGSRILLVLDDPKDRFANLFDGYRVAFELLFYAATLRHIHVLPDWYAVFANNTPDSQGFWGKEPEKALQNAVQRKADYVLVYHAASTALSDSWQARGFSPVAAFDWQVALDNELGGKRCWTARQSTPIWHILKVPVQS